MTTNIASILSRNLSGRPTRPKVEWDDWGHDWYNFKRYFSHSYSCDATRSNAPKYSFTSKSHNIPTHFRPIFLFCASFHWVIPSPKWPVEKRLIIIRELREFSNFAKTRVRMLSFHMFHFTMLFTSGRTCCDNILLCINTKLIFLNLNPSARQILFFLFPISQFWSDSIIITTALKD